MSNATVVVVASEDEARIPFGVHANILDRDRFNRWEIEDVYILVTQGDARIWMPGYMLQRIGSVKGYPEP
jgi:hypothetical protein